MLRTPLSLGQHLIVGPKSCRSDDHGKPRQLEHSLSDTVPSDRLKPPKAQRSQDDGVALCVRCFFHDALCDMIFTVRDDFALGGDSGSLQATHRLFDKDLSLS